MTTPSNLYAEKVFSEHPIALWALDDVANYISLISEADRDVTTWTATDGTASAESISKEPFPDSVTTLLTGDVPASTSGSMIFVSPNIINFTDLDQDLKTFCIGGYFYADSPFLTAVSIGFEYTDTVSSTIVQQLKKFETSIRNQWAFISSSFEIPNQNTNLRIVLKFEYNKIGSPPSSDYKFYVNGITLGQWSEEFCSASLGVETVSLPANIPLPVNNCIPADQYGLGGDSGYYLVQDNTLKTKNSSIPMVYGGSNVAILYPNVIDSENQPSLIIPGNGFLNQEGKYKIYGIEFWMRVECNSPISKRIFGPIASTDGLYVEGSFLTLKIGNTFASHFVGEWFRPMLININLINNSASLLINGEEVINLQIVTRDLDLPSITDSEGNVQDWLGFYTYEDVFPFELDCIAIYPYSVPVTVAKRRWVYGQGVPSPESINSSFGGVQALIDYTFADYTANYNYPDFANWDQGTFDNLATTQNVLRTPEYSLPEILIGNKTLQDLYDDNYAIQDPLDETFITFRPNSTWNDTQASFNLPRFNIINDGVHAVYGVFSSDNLSSEEMLFKIYNTLTGNYFTIKKDEDVIKYFLNYNGVEEEIYTTDLIVQDEKYAAGILINRMSEYFGGNVSAFFGNQNGLQMYVGGDETNLYQFTGKIYSFGLSTLYNADEIENHFDDNGTVLLDSYLATGSEESANAIDLLEHTASYTVLPTQSYDAQTSALTDPVYYLDIGVSGYWEDYLPLSYFGQFVQNQSGQSYYDLDFIQFNINYPKMSDTTSADIRTYISFQYISEGANAPQSSFSSIEPPSANGVLDVASYLNWNSKQFEIVDNTVIYPSKQINFNDLAIVYHLDFSSRGILTKPVTLRRLELSSQVFNVNRSNPINTRFGVQMFPFTRAGLYFDYKAKNPFSIYKGTTPYLYLNNNSGIEVRGDFDPLVGRGISIPINQTLASDYSVSAAQIWIKYGSDNFPSTETEIFEIRSLNNIIKFFIVATDDELKRAKILAVDAETGLPYNDLVYYINGTLVTDPVISLKEWTALGISFTSLLVFDSFLGSFNLTGNMLFNNISYYQANNLQQVQSNITRPWIFVKSFDGTDYDWTYWKENFTWFKMLVLDSTARYGTNPSDVYKVYIGTNKFIIDDNEGLEIISDNLSLYNDVFWSSNISTPV